MSYLDTIGAQDITPKEPGYLATIGATEGVSEVAPSQYIDSVEECGCHVEEPVREQGYLGWFANLAECLEAHPQPRLGMSFKNVTTRSVWLYDGVRWVNTTLGNPFTMINDEENAGWVRRGIAQSFYYLPKEEGEKQFAFEIEGGGSATISVPITSISEVVFIEWTGETLGYAIHQLDPDVVKNEGGVLKTLSGDVVIDINELLENIVILDQYTDDIDKRLHAEADRAKAAEQTLRDEITAVGDVAVKHEAQTLITGQKRTARNNIGAVGVSSVTEHGAQLEENGSAIYPTTQAKHVQLSNGVDSETMLYATHAKAKSVEDKLNAFFANAEVSGNAVDTLKELQEYITSDAEAAAEMLQRVSENAEAIATLSDDSVHYSAQSKSSSEQTQARRNIGAVGVAPVSGMTLLEHNGQSIYPTTNSSEVRMVDETGTYTGTLDEKLKWLEENSSIGGIMDDEGYLVSKGERVDMRFTRSLLPVGTSIPASANLNTIAYLKIGKYYCSMNADAKTLKNCPVNVAFSMEVFNPLGTNVDDETTKEYTYRLRVLTQYDTGQQYTQFCRTKGTPGSWVYESWYIIPRATFTLNSSKNDGTAALGSATQGIYLDATGLLKKMSYTLGKSVPSSAVFTDTKVTAVGNHYTPAEDESAVINADEGAVVTGIKRDAAGHVVGVISDVVEGGGSSDIYIFVRSGDSGVLSADEVAKLFAAKYVIVRDSGVVKNICASVITGESDVSFTYVSISIQAEMLYCQKVSITVGSDGVWSSVQSDYPVMQADWEAEEGTSAILNKPENLVVAEATDEEAEEAEGVPNVKYVAQTLTAGQQKQARENIGGAEATPSGDPMHYAYESAGAVWDGESWQADQRKGLTNEQVRQLFIKEDMSEMLFRKMWNMAGERMQYDKGYYDEATGFYRVNGLWHMTYEEALEVYVVTHNNNDSLWGAYSTRFTVAPITTMPFVGNRARPGFPCIMWCYRLVEHRTEIYDSNPGDAIWYDSNYADLFLGYSPNLRTLRDTYNLYGKSGYNINMGDMNSLMHFSLRLDRNINNLLVTFERMSYYTLHYMISKTNYTVTLRLHPTVYGFVTGTINPEELSQEPIRPELADYDLIPYQQNLKVVPDNAFWREELDVKGINGEYVYPSFAEYLANNPSNFATAEEWQALATLAQDKNVTLTQG